MFDCKTLALHWFRYILQLFLHNLTFSLKLFYSLTNLKAQKRKRKKRHRLKLSANNSFTLVCHFSIENEVLAGKCH